MAEVDEEVPEVSAWRLFGIAGMVVVLYVVLVAVDDSGFRPLLLGAAVVGGGVAGLVAVAVEQRLPVRRRRGRRKPSASAARSAVVGLTGVGLIVAQTLSGSGMRWFMLGGIAFVTAGATRAWIVQSRRSPGSP
ncbi:hypothetical protein IEZ26_17820 [Nocardioides cavernae]|uniref:Uncharacterized protein n=1 Tax=Nocardioides cavernae TaxID=1921566 RepID=A0ABR8NEC7_9ACTN|nr:hypothetical protein [Nocardioides cavernae]MBD3926487.1 hypothetical protein [Nocardioides cavernae]MBM7512206.1 hypothetical protein [Nocardioides cavernae]